MKKNINKIQITTINNPFNYADKSIVVCNRHGRKHLKSYLRDHMDAIKKNELVVSVNGRVVTYADYSMPIPKGAYIVIIPVVAGGGGGGKNIFAAIAGIALAVVTMGVGSMASGGAFVGANAIAATSWTTVGWMAAIATMAVGGILINALTPKPKIDMTSVEQSNTYSWAQGQVMSSQGGAVGITYGKVQPAIQLLAQHISSDGNKQYLNLLLCGGDGPIDDIGNIRINDNPINNYKGVELDIRYGTNDQTVIPNFNDQYADQGLNFTLADSNWSTQKLNANSTQGIEIIISFPAGLYYANDSGGLDYSWVDIEAEYRNIKYGSGSTNWVRFVGERVGGSQNSDLRKTYRVDNLEQGQYEVRVRCAAKQGGSTRHVNTVYWVQVSSIVYDDMVRPGKVLVGIRALASDQLSGGVPTIKWLQERKFVWVYVPGIGYQQKPANNPAWAAYDLIHYCKKLRDVRNNKDVYKVKGADHNRIIYNEFAEWAAFCVAKNLKVNLFMDTASDLWSKLQDIEEVGRGKVVLKGTRFGAICDKPSQAVQLFSMGNIVADSFNESFLAMRDRANSVEVTFNNAARNYERDTITVYSDDYDTDTAVKNPTQISIDGITDYEQAYREAKYRLYANKYLVRTINFEADVDSIACSVGDVVKVQHDLPQWGIGGRIVSSSDYSANTTEVVLDQMTTLEAGSSYQVMIRLSTDEIISKAVLNEPGQTDTLIIDGAGLGISKHDVYTLGNSGIEAKPFRVVSITRSSDMYRKITAIEYDERIYNEEYDIPSIDYVQPIYSEIESVNLNQETFVLSNGGMASKLHVSWKTTGRSLATNYILYLSTDGLNFDLWSTTSSKYIAIDVAPYAQYWVKVCANYSIYTTTGVVAGPVETVYTGKVPNISMLLVERTTYDTYRFTFESEFVPSNFSGYQFKFNFGKNTNWDTALPLADGFVTSSPYETKAVPSGTVTIMAKVIANDGSESEQAKYVVAGIGDVMTDNVVIHHDLAQQWSGAKENCQVIDGIVVPIDQQTMIYSDSVFIEDDGYLTINSKFAGNAIIWYRVKYPYKFYAGITDLFYDKDPNSDFYQETPYARYSGKVAIDIGQLDIKLEIPVSEDARELSGLEVIVDVPDVVEKRTGVKIEIGGTRIKPVRAFKEIQNVSVIIQGTATEQAYTIKIEDRDVASGPLVVLYDNSGASVEGIVNLTLQGY